MELAPHLDKLRSDLAAAAAVGGEDVATAARLLGDAVEPALRLVLLDLLTEAAEELTMQLGGATVEVRLHGREPELVASAGHLIDPEPAPEEPSAEEGTARLTVRLPESLKARCEAAAAAEGQSLNSWLIRAVSAALDGRGGGFPGGWPFPGNWPFPGGPGGPRGGHRGGPFPPGFPFPPPGGGRRVTGFGRA